MSEKPAHAYRSHAMQDDYCEQLLPHDSSKGTEWIACGLPRSAHPGELSDFGQKLAEEQSARVAAFNARSAHPASPPDPHPCNCSAAPYKHRHAGIIPASPPEPAPESDLMEALDGPFCFCTRCNHQPGTPCDKCGCKNEPRPAPESEEPPIVGNAYGTYSWRTDPAPEPEKLRRMAEEINSLAYAHAVTMHESIISGRGAVGWRDEELTQELLVHLEEIVRVSADEVGGVDEYSAIQILRHWGLSPESAPEPKP